MPVQFRLPFERKPPEPPATAPSLGPAVEFVRMRRARRYILRVRPDGTLRITLPRGGSRAEALRFAEEHRRWIEQERTRVTSEHTPITWNAGTAILLRGRKEIISISADGRTATYGDRAVPIDDAANLRPAIESDLKALARVELVPRMQALAVENAVSIERVLIRNQRSRWGSCAPSGAIALNFRLVQMPPDVRDYVLIHELMHRRQQNHSRRFWRLVEAACPHFRDAERWLKTQGRSLF
jgi:predicted metal-dependent hydrolase